MSSPCSVLDTLYAAYREHIPARNKDKFFAILDRPRGSNPSDLRDPNPNPQWIADTVDALDALVDPYHPLPPEQRKTRGEIRKAAFAQVWKRSSARQAEGQ